MQNEICVFAPDDIVAGQAHSLRSSLQISFSVVPCHVDNCLQVARTAMEGGVRVAVARGSIAARLRESNLDLAVSEIAIAGYDLIDTMRKAKELDSRIALVGFDNVLTGADKVARALGIELFTARIYSVADSAAGVEQAYREGFRVIIGGRRVVERAEALNMTAFPLYANIDNVRRALLEAERMAGVMRKQRESSARLRVTLDSIRDAIISFDTRGNILFFNSKAATYFRLANTAFPEEGFVEQCGLGKAIRKGDAWNDEVVSWHGKHYLCTINSVVSDGSITGWVAVLQTSFHVRNMEHKMRSLLNDRGHVATYTLADIVHASKATKELVETARFYAQSPSTVLLEGESGTGKELFAQGIHLESARRNGPFVAVNCAAIPESLMESELFGYAEGAFTGARRGGKAGLFELAHKGTLFMDEIGDMPLRLQAFLLRVLEEKSVTRVGQGINIPIDVRVICAINRDLYSLVKEGLFRADLYYRLNVLRLVVPPLRERPEDAAAILGHFFNTLPQNLGRPRPQVEDKAIQRLCGSAYPGNVREIRTRGEQLVITCRNGLITETAVAAQLEQTPAGNGAAVSPSPAHLPLHRERPHGKGILDRETRRLIAQTLEECGNNRTETARRLGISPTTLWRKLRAMREA